MLQEVLGGLVFSGRHEHIYSLTGLSRNNEDSKSFYICFHARFPNILQAPAKRPGKNELFDSVHILLLQLILLLFKQREFFGRYWKAVWAVGM